MVFSPSVTVEASNFTATEVGTTIGHSEFWTDTGSRLSGTQGPSYGEETETEGAEEDEDHLAYHGYEDDDDSLGPFLQHQREHPVQLPTHDGRGMFPSLTSQEEPVLMPEMASLEESLRLLAGRNNLFDEAEDLNTRIQKWRQEHSAAFMQEMEMVRNRKRRRRSQASNTRSEKEREEEMVASMMLDEDERAEERPDTARNDEKARVEKEIEEVPETFWRRVTRSLMRDIMGIDDRLLEAIFGESLPPEIPPTVPDPDIHDDAVGTKWERSLLETIARELGILLQQYTVHPTQGAFSSYPRWTPEQIANAGKKFETEGTKTPRPTSSPQEQVIADTVDSNAAVSSLSEVNFQPTLSQARQDSFSRQRAGNFIMNSEHDQHKSIDAGSEAQLRKEYWEQELGVRVFFSYLKSRFSSSPPLSISSKSVRKAATAMITEAHKPIYHQHPLIQRRHQPRRSTSGSTHSGQAPMMASSWGLLGMGGYRNNSSCASHSSRASKRSAKAKGTQSGAAGAGGAAASTLSKSFYWEVETSVGSAGGGSCVGGVGVWGEI